jgi:hypothetical protein
VPQKEIMRKNRVTYLLFWGALISSWLTFVVFFTAPLGLLAWLIILVVLFVRKSKLKWFLLAFSAWTFIPAANFLLGTKDYFIGQATMRYVGLPGPEFYNLDKDYRTWRSSSGCIVTGLEPLTQWPNNFAVKLWTNLLGFQKGVYGGVYPDPPEAAKIIERDGREVEISKTETAFRFAIDSRAIKVKRARNWNLPNIDSCKTAKVAIINDELIIIKPILRAAPQVTYLADNNSGEVFAEYYVYNENDLNR